MNYETEPLKTFQDFDYDVNVSGVYTIYLTDSLCLGISSTQKTSYATDCVIKFSKIDTVNKIVAGTLHFIFPIPGCDTLNVAEGRFDYRYHIQN